MVAAGDEMEPLPWGISADLSLFGIPCLSLFRGVPPDLVVTPVGSGDSLTGCLLAVLA